MNTYSGIRTKYYPVHDHANGTCIEAGSLATFEVVDVPFVINSERWPVVVIRFPPKITHEGIDAFYAELERVYARGATDEGPFVSINDLYMMNAAHALAPVRKYMAEKVDHLFRTYRSKRGEAIVTNSAIIRGIATAHYWVRKEDAFERAVFENVSDAILWAENLLGVTK